MDRVPFTFLFSLSFKRRPLKTFTMIKFYQTIFFTLFISFTFSTDPVNAQQLAFPGAEGFGRFTTGGRGGEVYLVTNLNDSGPGSLRAGLEMSGARTIIFRVSGTIHLEKQIRIRNGDLTIAGQTAPGDGIAIKGNGIVIDANNVIIRYIRIRPGDIAGAELDALWGRENKNIIIDHCSFSWATDEVASFYDNENFTLQWCILSESLYQSVHAKGRHGYGGIWGGVGATFHHNLLAHHSSRNPRFNGARYTTTPETELVDHRNNVIFNWGGNSAYGGEGGNHNIVANYYKPGPATSGEKRFRIIEPDKASDVPLGRWYVADNYVEGYPEVTADNWNGGVQDLSEEDLALARVNEPFNYAPVETQTAPEAYLSVLAEAGASFPYRDPVDSRIVEEVETGEVTYGGVYGVGKGIIDTQETVGGWPVLFSAPAPEDSDLDGMPDEWELANGTDPQDAADQNEDLDADGYTNLEEYLNGILGTEPDAFLKHPANVAVLEATTTSLSLSWEDYADNETEIVVERSTEGEEFAVVATLPADATTFQDEDLLPETLYLYRLMAVNETEASAYSLVVSGTTLPEPVAPNPEGLVGYWGFDAESGTEVEDKSAFGNNGEVQELENPEWIEGKINNAIDLSQATASTHIEVPDEDQLNFDDNSFTVSLWMKASGLDGQAYLFHKGSFEENASTGASGKWYGLELEGNNIRFAVDDNISKSAVTADNTDFLTGEWVHVVVVRDRESKSLRIYRNGVLVKEERDYTLNSLTQTDPLIIGNSAELAAPFKGGLDEVKLFNYALSPSEIGGLYSSIHMQASMPSPSDGAMGVQPGELVFSWAGDAPAYNLYVGTTPENLELVAEGLTSSSYTASDLEASTEYFWRVDAVGADGTVADGEVWSFASGEITALHAPGLEESSFSCSPNPFADQLKINFKIDKREAVLLSMYNMQNQLIRMFVNSSLNPGEYEVRLNVEEGLTQNLPEGMYFCVLQTSDKKEVRRVILLKD